MVRSAAVLGETVPPPDRAFDRVAGVEQHGAAVLHVGVDLLQRLARGARRARHHRPVDQRIERELVLAGIDPDRIAGFERGALREEQRQPLQAGAADAVDLVVAGDDIGEAGLQRRAQRRGVVLRLSRLRQHQRRGDDRERDGGGGRARPAAEQLGDPARQEEHHERVEREQAHRRQHDRTAQILRLAHAIDVAARIEAGEIERRQLVVGRERIDRQQSLGRAVESGRVIDGGAAGVAGGDRPGIVRRRPEHAEAVEDAGRRHHLASGAGAVAVGGRGRAGERNDALEHVDERAGHRQVRPARVGADMEQDDHALAARLRGDQRRAVGERRPGAIGERGVGLGQHLAVHGHVGRHRHVGERALARERRELLRLVPAQRAAERAAAAAQLHRNEIVVAGGEPRAGEAHQHAAVLDPLGQALARFGDIADVGEDDHRQPLVQELVDRLRRRAAIGLPHIGKRIERARQIVGRGQQRLCGVGGGAGDDADRAAAPALVKELNGSGGALGADVEPRDVVADLDRQRQRGFGLGVVGAERERRLAERQALEVEPADHAGLRAALGGAQDLHRQRAGGVLGAGQRERRRAGRLRSRSSGAFRPGARAPRRNPGRRRHRCRRRARPSRRPTVAP